MKYEIGDIGKDIIGAGKITSLILVFFGIWGLISAPLGYVVYSIYPESQSFVNEDLDYVAMITAIGWLSSIGLMGIFVMFSLPFESYKSAKTGYQFKHHFNDVPAFTFKMYIKECLKYFVKTKGE